MARRNLLDRTTAQLAPQVFAIEILVLPLDQKPHTEVFENPLSDLGRRRGRLPVRLTHGAGESEQRRSQGPRPLETKTCVAHTNSTLAKASLGNKHMQHRRVRRAGNVEGRPIRDHRHFAGHDDGRCPRARGDRDRSLEDKAHVNGVGAREGQLQNPHLRHRDDGDGERAQLAPMYLKANRAITPHVKTLRDSFDELTSKGATALDVVNCAPHIGYR